MVRNISAGDRRARAEAERGVCLGFEGDIRSQSQEVEGEPWSDMTCFSAGYSVAVVLAGTPRREKVDPAGDYVCGERAESKRRIASS